MKNSKTFWAIAAAAAFFGLILYAQPDVGGRPDGQQNIVKGTGSLKAVEEKFDFGSISMANGNVKHTFTVKNTGDSAVSVDKMYTSCMCTTATMIKGEKKYGPFGMPGHSPIPKISAVLEPGEEVTVEAVFDPNAHGPAGVGKIERVIVLENSAGAPVELGFTAMVTP